MNKLVGNAVVGQSGGPTAAINATLAGVIRGVLEDVGEGAIKQIPLCVECEQTTARELGILRFWIEPFE